MPYNPYLQNYQQNFQQNYQNQIIPIPSEMDEAGYSNGYSGRNNADMPYDRGNSYARGRGSNAKRDSMGRYSRDYAMDDLHDKLKEMMEDATNEREREAIRKVMNMM